MIGAGVALYMSGTSLLGSPLDNWQQTARAGLAAFLVGICLVGFSLWIALHEHFFEWFRKGKRAAGVPAPTAPVTARGESAPLLAAGTIPAEVDAVLDEFLAGKISRDEAETRILEITQPHMSARA